MGSSQAGRFFGLNPDKQIYIFMFWYIGYVIKKTVIEEIYCTER